jgi:hypothetical protein
MPSASLSSWQTVRLGSLAHIDTQCAAVVAAARPLGAAVAMEDFTVGKKRPKLGFCTTAGKRAGLWNSEDSSALVARAFTAFASRESLRRLISSCGRTNWSQ